MWELQLCPLAVIYLRMDNERQKCNVESESVCSMELGQSHCFPGSLNPCFHGVFEVKFVIDKPQLTMTAGQDTGKSDLNKTQTL